MPSPHQTITGELRKWQRKDGGVEGYVYDSHIWDEGEYAFLKSEGAYLHDCATFYLFVMATQVYKLPKDEERV